MSLLRCVVTIVVPLLLTPISAMAQVSSLSGMCIDNGAAGCQGRYLPFDKLSINFCEETCTLTNPVEVRDLNATLYDMTCRADYPTQSGGRVMVLSQTGFDAKTRLSFIERGETRSIIPCP